MVIPCDAPNGAYTFTARSDYNGIITTATATFQSSGSGGTTPPTPPPPPNTGSADNTLRIPNLTSDFTRGPQALRGCVDTYSGRTVVHAQALIAQGGSPLSGYSWTLANLSAYPPGTTVDALTGIFKTNGSPLRAGTFTFTMEVSDGSKTATGAFELVVASESSKPIDIGDGIFVSVPACPTPAFAQPTVTPIVLPNAKAATAYGVGVPVFLGIAQLAGQTVTVSSGPLNWALANGSVLPPGMALDQSRGVVRGTPLSSAAGNTYRFSVLITSQAPGTVGAVASCSGAPCPQYVITVQQ